MTQKNAGPLQSEIDETSSSETESDSSSEEDFQEEAHNKSVDCALDVKIDGWSLMRNMKKNISLVMSMVVSGSEAKVQSVKALAYISYRNCVKLLSLVVNTVLI